MPASETVLGLWNLMAMRCLPHGKEAHGFRSDGHDVKHKTGAYRRRRPRGLARRRGSSRRPACPSCCTRCGRCAAPRRISPNGWPSWSAPTPSAPTMPQNNAVGLLHEEMRRAGSLIMRAADAHKLPAGGALAVDRHGFSAAVQAALLAHPLVELRREEVAGLPPADGTASSSPPAPSPRRPWPRRSPPLTGEESLAFFDAIAPIVHHDSIDLSIAWKQSRYDKGGPAGDGADYINCPLDKERVRRLRRGAAGRRQDRVQGVGAQHALLRRLPADRGDRRARARRPCASGR